MNNFSALLNNLQLFVYIIISYIPYLFVGLSFLAILVLLVRDVIYVVRDGADLFKDWFDE